MSKARYLATYPETTPGSFPGGTPTETFWRLVGDDAFSMDPAPQTVDIRTADSNNRLIDEESSRVVMRGKLSTYLYPAQAAELFGWATTLDANGELPSRSGRYFDGTVFSENLGMYIEQLQMQAQAEQDEGIVKVMLDLVAIKPGTAPTIVTFPPPDLGADFPTTNPYKLIESAGGLKIIDTGSTTRTKYNSFTLTIKNILSANFDEAKYVSDITYHGRDITLEADIRYISNADRAFYEGRTKMIASLILGKGVTPAKQQLTLDLKTGNKISQLAKSQPLAKPGYQKMTLKNILDSTGADFSFAFATV